MMPRDPRYDVLFEPVRIGPVTAPDRFYQVPHCTGMRYAKPETLAAMRGVKARFKNSVVLDLSPSRPRTRASPSGCAA